MGKSRLYIVLAMLVGAVGVAGAVLANTNVKAETASANAVVIVPASCNFEGEPNSAHNAEIPASQYQDDIGETYLRVTCNDNGGFAIYAIGYSDNTFGNNKLIATLGGELSPTYDIVTGIATSGATSNWAMKLIASDGTYVPTVVSPYGDYAVVPNTYTKVASYTSVTDSTIGATVGVTYAAYIAGSQPAGNYNSKVKFTMVHPASEVPAQPQTTQSGKICYYANVTDAVGTMGCQTIPTSGTTDGVSPTSATLLASNFSRTGYGFAGWSDAFDYKTNENTKFYGPQETITYENGQYVGEGKGLSLSALTDQRDNQTYAIAKLADGKCWMIENLRLESTNSDNNTGALAQDYGTSTTYGNFSGLADAESTGFSSTYTANSLYYSGTQEGTASIDIGISNYPAYRMPRYNNTNTSARASSPIGNGVAMYSYGNYYTWHAAIADLTYNNTTTNAAGKTATAAIRSFPNNFLYSGCFNAFEICDCSVAHLIENTVCGII